MSSVTLRLIVLLATAAVSPCLGQTISSLQSSQVGSNPANVTGITSGTNISGFSLYINGAFDLASFLNVQWLNTSTNVTTTFTTGTAVVTPTQIVVTIPFALYQTVVTAPVDVIVTVQEASGKATANFTINPPLQALGPILPAGTLNQTYTTNLTKGGTPPFVEASVTGGSQPPGIFPQIADATLTGTPTQTGVFSFQIVAVDFWNNTVNGSDTIEIVDVPTVTSILPNSSGTGAGNLTMTVDGTNFVDQVAVGAQQIPGSQVQWISSVITPLTTTFVSPTRLTAIIPSTLLATPAFSGVAVLQPSNAGSNVVPFTVGPPSISTIGPTSVPAGSPATPLTVSGTNFVANATTQAGSTISLNGVALLTTVVNSGTLTATVPDTLLSASIAYSVQVTNPGGTVSNTAQFLVLAPGISSLSATSTPAGSPAFGLTVTGANYLSGSRVVFRGTTLIPTATSSSALTVTVPANLVAAAGLADVQVINPRGASSNIVGFNVTASLAIVTTSLPAGVPGNNYTATLTGKGGTPPYTWSAAGLPAALVLNPATGVISGVLQGAGSSVITVVLQDAAKSTVTAQFPLQTGPPPPPPVSIAPSSNLPPGVVGVAYTGFVFANGGTEPYTFSLGSGSLPDGLTLSSGGQVSGTPKAPGQFPFSVVARDSAGESASGNFVIIIQPAPLNITGGPSGPVPTGAPINIPFVGTGGVSPYRCTPGGTLPPGTSFGNCGLSGTPTTTGVFAFRVTLADSTGATITKDYTLTVTVPPLSLSGTVGNGKVGVSYSGQLSAAGGTGPYTYTVSGLPDGLSLSASGGISGIPTAEGQFSLAATATDSKGATANATFRIAIAPADLVIVTASLPDGVLGAAYSTSLSASGGVKPHTWTVTGLPNGITATAAGILSGTPRIAGAFPVAASVKDAAGAEATKSYTLTVVPAPLVITTTSAPNGTVGTAYSASFAATGGTAPLTFSATGLPAGLSMSAAGVISGTPTAPGAATIVVTVKDSTGAGTSKSFPVSIALPPTPPLNFGGISNTSGPLQQPRLTVSLGSPYPVDVVVTLTLTFVADNGPDDLTIQFSTGGRTARITIPAGSLNGATDVGVQTGSVAGLITITSQMQASGQDITPTPAPRSTIRIAAAAPVIVPGSFTAVRNSTGFTATLTGYVTDREMTQVIFTFTPAAGSNLQTTTLTVAIDAMFAQYFSGPSAAAFGSQFTYTQPFTVTGSSQAIASVTVVLVNRIGQSAPATAPLN